MRYCENDLLGKPVTELRNPLFVKPVDRAPMLMLRMPPIILRALWIHGMLRRLRGKKRVL